jgi:hypothetical protein
MASHPQSLTRAIETLSCSALSGCAQAKALIAQEIERKRALPIHPEPHDRVRRGGLGGNATSLRLL